MSVLRSRAGSLWRDPRTAAAATIALLAFHLGSLLVVGGIVGFPLDDAWIHLELARHMAAGDGLAYEAGQPVTASTSPLWTGLLSLGFLVGRPEAWSLLLGVSFHVATVLGAARLAVALDLPPFARIGGPWVVATTPWLLWSGLSGMEVPLAAALGVHGLALHHRALAEGRPDDRAGLALLALAPLARPEALLLLGLALLDRWPRLDGRGRRLDALVALVGVGPVAAAYTILGGSPLPTTLGAKAGAGGGSLRAAVGLGRVAVDVFFRSLPILFLFAVPGIVRRLAEARRRGAAALLWAPGLVAAYALLARDGGPVPVGNFGRYLFPLLPIAALFGLAGLADVLAEKRARLTAAVVLSLAQAGLLAGSPALYVHTVADVTATDVAAARWLAENAAPDHLVAAQDVGAVGYLAPQRILGLVGIVEPEVRRVLATDDGTHWEERLLRWLDRRRPDLLVVFRRSYPMLTSREDFRVLARFERPENRTMAGPELLVLATPWCRGACGASAEAAGPDGPQTPSAEAKLLGSEDSVEPQPQPPGT